MSRTDEATAMVLEAYDRAADCCPFCHKASPQDPYSTLYVERSKRVPPGQHQGRILHKRGCIAARLIPGAMLEEGVVQDEVIASLVLPEEDTGQ